MLHEGPNKCVGLLNAGVHLLAKMRPVLLPLILALVSLAQANPDYEGGWTNVNLLNI